MSQPIVDFTSFKEYFKGIATGTNGHVDLKYFQIGGSERIISDQRSKIQYKALWLEDPEVKFYDNKADDFKGGFKSAFAILQNCPTNDWEAQDLAKQETFIIALDVISKMIHDKRGRTQTPMFYLDLNSLSMDCVNSMMIDNDFGWRVEFNLSNNVDVCFNPLKWKS